MSSAGLLRRVSVDLWEMMSSLQSSSSYKQSPQLWILVTQRGGLLQRITGSTFFPPSNLKIIPKSARGRGCTAYLIVIMYISMDTLINKTMSKSMEVTLKVYT